MGEKYFSNMIGKLLLVLALYGALPGERTKRFLGLMNTDSQHSIIRIPTTLALLYAGKEESDLATTRTVLTAFGGLCVAIGSVGLVSKRVGGALPSGLTNFDIAYHFGLGFTALWLGRRPGRMAMR
jgi:hypothetical protein